MQKTGLGFLCAAVAAGLGLSDPADAAGRVAAVRIDPALQTGTIDYAGARPFDLPELSAGFAARAEQDRHNAGSATAPASAETPGSEPGATGTGERSPVTLPLPAPLDEPPASAEFGTSGQPFNTARADAASGTTNTLYPYRASGKLFFTKDGQSFLCSASLIKKGVIVTAAHCVAEFGANRLYSNFQFVAGYRNRSAPYGIQTAKEVVLLSAYLNGTDPCASRGVTCRDDIAVIVLSANVGTATGYYGYGWNGYGFTPGGLTQVTQIGYPSCLDSGLLMARNDAYGYKSPSLSGNTLIGSLMCGGSSGGPWLVNFGQRPVLSGASAGSYPEPNRVVGVTSWGFTSGGPKQMGASAFTSSNIVPIVAKACRDFPGSC